MKTDNYVEINRSAWNNKVDAHINSEFYNVDGFLKGESSLNNIELELLGEIKGKSILHLQCHFGQDTISLSRLGANVCGADFSDKAINEARNFAEQTGSSAEFVCCDIYELDKHLNKEFDIVYTSYGTVGWLPDLNKWAKIISKFLKPGGRFVFVEFHPVVWMFDDNFKGIKYSYFNLEPIIENENGTYADKNAPISQTSIGWNHSLSEVINSLISNGLKIEDFKEYDYSPYNCLNEMTEVEQGKFMIKGFEKKLPLLYSISAKKII